MRNSQSSAHKPPYGGASRGRGGSLPPDTSIGGTCTGGACTGGTCTAVIGSMTQAMKAQSLLADAAIRGGITKISSARTHNGCAYGVEFPCTQSANVRTVLERGGVRVREYLQE